MLILRKTKERITGKLDRYHNTKNENVDNILKEGIKSSYAEDPNNLTNVKAIPKTEMEKKKGLVYLATNKEYADRIGAIRAIQLDKKEGDRPKDELNRLVEEEIKNPKYSKTLKLELPYQEFKDKFKENPEKRGAKTFKEFDREYRKETGKPGSKKKWKRLRNETDTIEGDIDPKYIVDGKGHEKYGLKEWKDYVKNNPARFASGVAIASSPAVVGLGAAKLARKLIKKK